MTEDANRASRGAIRMCRILADETGHDHGLKWRPAVAFEGTGPAQAWAVCEIGRVELVQELAEGPYSYRATLTDHGVTTISDDCESPVGAFRKAHAELLEGIKRVKGIDWVLDWIFRAVLIAAAAALIFSAYVGFVAS